MNLFNNIFSNTKVDRKCQEGEKLLHDGQFKQAAASFKDVLKINPGSARAHAGLGRSLYHLLAGLEESHSDALSKGGYQLASEDIDLFLSLPGKSIEEMETAIKLGYQSDELYSELGDLYMKFGSIQVSEGHLLRALQLNPQNHTAHFKLGLIYQSQEDYSRAIEHLEVARNLEPHDPKYHFELGQAYYKSNRFAESIPCYQTAIELKPDYTDAIFNLGTSLFNSGRRSQAMEVYRSFLRLEPFSKDANNLKSQLPELMGDI